MREEHAKLVEHELNKVIDRCLWGKSTRKRDPALLNRAAAAYVALKTLGLAVIGERDVVRVLGGDNLTSKDYIGAYPVPLVGAPR